MSESAAKLTTLYGDFVKQFPDVRGVTARQLNEELQSPSGKDIILVDVRTPDEQKVSRLPGNVINSDSFESTNTAKATPLVTYCTAGLRSGKYAAQLQKKGFTDVRNLEGSILAWVSAP